MILKRLSLGGLPLVALAACHVVFPYGSADSAGAREGTVLDGPPRSEMKARDAVLDRPLVVKPDGGPACPSGTWCLWNTATGTVLHDVWGTSASDFYVAGEGINAVPVILRSTATGWSPVTLGSSSITRTVGAVNAVFARASGAATYLLAGADDAIYSGDPNASLTGAQDPTPTIYTGVWAKPDIDVVVGYRKTTRVARYRLNSAKVWQDLGSNLTSSTANMPLMAVTGFSDTVFAAGNQGLVLQCEKSGACAELAWSAGGAVNPQVVNFKGAWTSSAQLVIVGENTTTSPSMGYVVFYDRKNSTSTAVQLSAAVNDVWGSSDSDIFVVGADDLVARFSSPSSYAIENQGGTGTLNGVWGDGAGFVVAVGSGGRTRVRGP